MRGGGGLPTSERLPFLEGIRGLLALYVTLGHLGTLADPSGLTGKPSAAPAWMQSLLVPFAFGHLAVAMFILVSGFCLQLSLYVGNAGDLPHPARFFARRARRILPPYYVTLFISLLVCWGITDRQVGMPFEMYVPVTPAAFWTHVFLVHNFNVDWMYRINGVLWSIAIEAQLYVLFPLLVLLLRRGGRWLFLLANASVVALIFFAVPGANKLYPWYLLLFSMGMVAAALAYRPSVSIGVRPALGGTLTLIGLAVFGVGSAISAPLPVRDILFGAFGASLLYTLTVRPDGWLTRPLISLLASAPLYRLGLFSYSLYLMHHPLLQVGYAVRPSGFDSPDQKLGFLLAMLPLVLAGCYGFYVLFERRFVRGSSDTAQEDLRAGFPLALPLRGWADDAAASA